MQKLQTILAAPDFYQKESTARIQEIATQQRQLADDIAVAEAAWLNAAEALEAATS
jgi:hypothetical protein